MMRFWKVLGRWKQVFWVWILEQTRNTYFNGILLPVIDVTELLRESPSASSE